MNTFEYYDRRKDEWSASETEELRMEYLYKRFTIGQIADIHRRTPGDILYKCKELNIISEYKYARGYSDYINSNLYYQIMAKVDYEKKKRLENHAGKRWTLQEDSQLISEYNSGIHIRQMCRIHQRKIGGITSRLERLRCINSTEKSEYVAKNVGTIEQNEYVSKCVGTIEQNEIKKDIKDIKKDIRELKENIKELSGLLHSLYEFETV